MSHLVSVKVLLPLERPATFVTLDLCAVAVDSLLMFHQHCVVRELLGAETAAEAFGHCVRPLGRGEKLNNYSPVSTHN